jgi:hypothetical protein
MQHFLKDLIITFSGLAFHETDTHRVTSEGAARLIFPVSVNSWAGSTIQVRYCWLNLSLKGLLMDMSTGFNTGHSTRDDIKLSFHLAELILHGISDMPFESIKNKH